MSEIKSSEDEPLCEGEDSSDDTVTSDDYNDEEEEIAQLYNVVIA